MVNSIELDEAAHYGPPYQDLHCLQIQLFSSLVVKELIKMVHHGLVNKMSLYKMILCVHCELNWSRAFMQSSP